LKRGVKTWSFVLYDSVEAAFYLKDEPFYDDAVEEYRQVVAMKPGEIIEIEWMGSEWIYDDEDASAVTKRASSTQKEKFDNVHVGKLSPLKGAPRKSGCLEVYSGWVRGGSVPWEEDDARKDVRITSINDKVKPKIDFTGLFSEDEGEIEKGEGGAIN
jgi:hypothetical protein